MLEFLRLSGHLTWISFKSRQVHSQGFRGKEFYMGKSQPKLKELIIIRDWCKGCGICIHFCPKKVLELDKRDKVVIQRPEDCVCCRMCELRCPDFAIEVIIEDEK